MPETIDHQTLCRPEVRTLPRYNAGLSEDAVKRRFGVSEISKLGSNENPYGPSPEVLRQWPALAQRLFRYPDAGATGLREGIARFNDIAPDRVVIGNGSEQIIRMIAEGWLSPGERVVTVRPAFGLHEIHPLLMGAVVDAVPVTPGAEFDIDGLCHALSRPAKILIFSNPSNPVGCMMTADALRRVIAACSPRTLIVVDEAYREYAEIDADYPDARAILREQGRPWLCLRTFSKAYGLAALRIGYALASSAEVASVLETVRDTFNTTMPAQEMATIALTDPDHMRACVARTVASRARMAAALRAMGLFVAPAHTNFLFFRTAHDAMDVAGALLRHGVIVKPWKEKGFENWIRVSVGLPHDNERFLAHLSAVLAQAGDRKAV
ncbi:aminotransferase class I/II-fold pyridoxal phosphate-dependent enzyme [Novacetimonas hansenii]|uniref:Histidinol-phosphate aminotransferase n=2 Tax=Novacetimonas hansenii TaxID=436 RepID=A0ABQ0SHJ0_NOVHA|nr:aminotransferase class I/II-fold pyridoxal phosphate-dependent enzyme [Novacetimonas hansenii]EFG85934.1 histidinol-phosphate aminotransferase [Novacetimonas hansenii ATCC 23769]MBL7237446.1 aminotransferase class I/II-fold pyridoxal phosphate-dependent enzyme [Novacetimonas hansenii]QOF95423.1 aminotransferase class I/II-fold pyridoxal phosphate-dependent enzyme [Novacetimonas hansenii]GAN84967.1 histidinol-phosphate aminotransferase [Novacetimonas hansenii JCM 7643]GBQ59231.1 histidinol-p